MPLTTPPSVIRQHCLPHKTYVFLTPPLHTYTHSHKYILVCRSIYDVCVSAPTCSIFVIVCFENFSFVWQTTLAYNKGSILGFMFFLYKLTYANCKDINYFIVAHRMNAYACLPLCVGVDVGGGLHGHVVEGILL